MPLKLDFKSGEKMVINGAVVENIGPNAKILVHNIAAILRDKEVLTEKDCVTPAARVYFALQCAYVFPEKHDHYIKLFDKYLTDFVGACPSAADIAEEIRANVTSEDLYKGLKGVRRLIAYEAETLNSFHEGMAKLAAMAETDDADELA
ncbi:MAG: flagellum biosynthesis protein FlbT [Rhodospirillaceae bacterium]|nr:flagellum biosynthesis protein FlbT [Rhodospirillaceae bacterium]